MKYYILYNDENRGPLELHELEEFGLNPASRVWSPGWPGWKDAGEVPEIQEYFSNREAEARRQREQEEQARREAQEQEEKAAREAREQAERAARSEQDARAAWDKAQAADDGKAAQEQAQTVEIEWYIAVDDREVGPVKVTELTGLGLTPDTLVWHDNLTNWTPAREVAELRSLLETIAARNAGNNQVAVSGSTWSDATGSGSSFDSDRPGNTYTTAIFGVIAAVAAILIVFAKAEYYHMSEKLVLICYCAAVPFLLSVGSLICAKNAASAPSQANAFKQEGLSIGLGIGAVLASIVGILIAINDFYLA